MNPHRDDREHGKKFIHGILGEDIEIYDHEHDDDGNVTKYHPDFIEDFKEHINEADKHIKSLHPDWSPDDAFKHGDHIYQHSIDIFSPRDPKATHPPSSRESNEDAANSIGMHPKLKNVMHSVSEKMSDGTYDDRPPY